MSMECFNWDSKEDIERHKNMTREEVIDDIYDKLERLKNLYDKDLQDLRSYMIRHEMVITLDVLAQYVKTFKSEE